MDSMVQTAPPLVDTRFVALAESLGALVSLHAAGGNCLFVSAAARELFGAEPSELVGRDWRELVPAEDVNPFGCGETLNVSHRLLRPYGPPLVAETAVTPVREKGEVLCVTRPLDADGWELPDSLRDRLTGLPAGPALVERLGTLLSEAQIAVAAVVIDLDHLAAINARFGREGGERVLAETARRVQAMLRPSDMLGRLAGDELCALCVGASEYEAAERIAERVRALVARPLPFEPVMATASVGAALGSPGADPEAVLRLARGAALAVKQRGGDAAELHRG